MNAPFVSVIIVNYNSGDRLEKCLSHLEAQSVQDFEVIVVDNASTDQSAQAARDRNNVQLIDAGDNIGFAAANNLAARSAKGTWIACLNPDAYAAPDWLAEFTAGQSRWPGVDAFGSCQIDATRPDVLDGTGDVVHGFGLYYRGNFGKSIEDLPEEGECFSPCAAAAFYRRATFDDLGGFDERFFCYGEDVDLGFRLRRRGGRAVQLSRAIVHHEGSGVTGRRSDFSIYHGVRNRLWLFRKNLSPALFWGLAPLHALVNLMMLARSAVGGEAGPYWRGLRDGFKGMASIEPAPSGENSTVFLSWSPVMLINRRADIRKTAPHGGR